MARFGVLIAVAAAFLVATAALLLSLLTGLHGTAEQTAATSAEAGLIWFSAGGFALLASFALVARMKIRARRTTTGGSRPTHVLRPVEA
jgi:hypothetical protein